MTTQTKSEQAIAVWLFVMCGLIFAMVLLGGITRLTHSGLSMVEWRPLMGTLPPMSETDWQEVFEKYKQFPEYQKINLGMTLSEFKRIFLFEYSHRVLGRAIGIAFALPFLYFLIRRRLTWYLASRLVVMFVLGGLQGLLGWYMVQSGLVERPDVSAYRLTAHLGLAVVIYAYILWVAMSLWHTRGVAAPKSRQGLRIAAPIVTGTIFLTILSGGLVAGNDAGLAYNSFPLMDGRFVPADIFRLEPWWRNFFENLPLVQLDHRLFALLSVIASLMVWCLSLRESLSCGARRAFTGWAAMVLVQLGLGIATLLLFVPIWVGALHQAGALLTFTMALWACHELSPKVSNNAR
ncbi:MAG: heme A synthase [Rhodospirillaceae bacterium]|nr:heme A synthase [Rhodospirillaceae bacterium]